MSSTISPILIQYVQKKVKDYCHERGAWEGPGINNLVPHDSINAYAMAKHLIQDIGFCHYVSVAPEGHIYGYFFSRIGAHPIAVSVDYPPTKVTAQADVSQISGGTVLIIEDDVVGGGTLRLVVQELLKFKPRSVSLFLGHSKIFQHFENIPREIDKVYIAEDILSRDGYLKRADELYEEFQKELL